MKLIFLGVGEAFDNNLPNNSLLILSDTKLLLDCGYSIPQQLWKYNEDPEFLDAIYLSHPHADHYFGLPALFVRMWEDNRKKPLTIICQKDMQKLIEQALEIGYKGFKEKFEFSINFIEVEAGQQLMIKEFVLNFAPTTHSADNLAIKICNGENCLCYSGDGMFNQNTVVLYKNSDLLVHEAYLYDEQKIGHASIQDLINMAINNNIKTLALTHINRNLRKQISEIKDKISQLDAKDLNIIIPEPLEVFKIN